MGFSLENHDSRESQLRALRARPRIARHLASTKAPPKKTTAPPDMVCKFTLDEGV